MIRSKKEAMAIAVDLIVDDEAETLCDGIGLDHNHIYTEMPDKCPKCKSVRFHGYEILGSSVPEIIMWECRRCESRFPKFPLDKMETILEEVQGVWTNPNDWGHVSKGDYN